MIRTTNAEDADKSTKRKNSLINKLNNKDTKLFSEKNISGVIRVDYNKKIKVTNDIINIENESEDKMEDDTDESTTSNTNTVMHTEDNNETLKLKDTIIQHQLNLQIADKPVNYTRNLILDLSMSWLKNQR